MIYISDPSIYPSFHPSFQGALLLEASSHGRLTKGAPICSLHAGAKYPSPAKLPKNLQDAK